MRARHLFVLVLAASEARADQVLLLDTGEYTHLADNTERNRPIKNDPATRGSHAYFRPSATAPRNWVTPVNYREGKIHYIIDVVAKPTAAITRLSFCMESPGAFCVGQTAFTGVGHHTSNGQRPGGFYISGADFSRAFAMAAIVLRDGSTRPAEGYKLDPGQSYIGAPNASLYFPLKMRVRVYAVSQGATFQPPDGLPTPGPDAGADVRPIPPPDAGPPVSADSTTPDATASAGPEPVDARPPVDGSRAPDPEEPTRPPDKTRASPASSGCAVAPGSTAPWGLLVWLLVAGWIRQR